MRKMLTEVITSDPDMEVVGVARDGEDALMKAKKLQPNVITLDVEMPVMTGEEALKRIMKEVPTPVIMLSSLTQQGSDMSVKCLSEGAVDAIGKPSGSLSLDIKKISGEILHKVKAASKVNLSAYTVVHKPTASPQIKSSESVGLVLIGCSTGGPRALQTLVPMLPKDLGVPVVIVQHMPPQFTQSLAQRLNQVSQLEVREARPGDSLSAGVALVAPGGVHLKFEAGKARLTDEPPIHGVRPAIDITLSSLVASYGSKTLAVLLTGMGKDGAAGLKAIRSAGGHTIAEHESTCIVYGMPRAAVELGAAEHILPLDQIASAIEGYTRGGFRRAA